MPRNKLPLLALGLMLSVAMMVMAAGCFRGDGSASKAEPASKHVEAAGSEVAVSPGDAKKRRLATRPSDDVVAPLLPLPTPPKAAELTPPDARSSVSEDLAPPAAAERIGPAAMATSIPAGTNNVEPPSADSQDGSPGLRPNPLRTNEVPAFPTRVVQGEPPGALPAPPTGSPASPSTTPAATLPPSAGPATIPPVAQSMPAAPLTKPSASEPAASPSAAVAAQTSGPIAAGPVIDPGPASKPLAEPARLPSTPGVAAGANRGSAGVTAGASSGSTGVVAAAGSGSAGVAAGATRGSAAAPARSTATDPSAAVNTPPLLLDSAKPWGKGKHSGIPFDPVKENGKIFEGWTTPQFALLISGRQEGYLEPCGCAGLDRMKGGLSRRYSLCQQLRTDGWPKGSASPWPLVAVDLGGQIKGYDQQAVFKFQATAEALSKMGYDAVGLGVGELRLPAGDVLVAALDFAAGGQGRFVSANVGVLDSPGKIPQLPTKQIVVAGGKKIGITAALGKTWQQQINNNGLQMSDPAAAIPAVLAELKAQQCDLLVLLSHASEQDSIALARQFPDFDVVVTAGGPPEPPNDKQFVPGTKTLLVTTGEKGMNAIVLGFYNDPQNPIRYQRVPLDSRFAIAPEITLVMRNYQEKLKNWVQSTPPKAEPAYPRADLLGKFVGSQKCKECHEGSYKTWLKTPHSQAWETLKSKTDPPRTFDPECISCHVTGWNTTQFFPYDSGFQSEKETPQLINVGCESCHGPGEKHILAEKGKDVVLQKKLEDAMILTKEQAEKRYCFTCHDGDNSPDFDFKTYWPFIAHKD